MCLAPQWTERHVSLRSYCLGTQGLVGGSAMMLYDAISILSLGGNSVLQQGRVSMMPFALVAEPQSLALLS